MSENKSNDKKKKASKKLKKDLTIDKNQNSAE